MAFVWAVLYAISIWWLGRAVVLALAAAVFSHFVLDLPMHPPDLALWPHSNVHVGFGLWRRFPTGWWWMELAFIASGCLYYLARARTRKTFGGHALWVCFVVVTLHVINSPWLSPAAK